MRYFFAWLMISRTHAHTQLPSPQPEEPAAAGGEAMEVEGSPEGGAATAATAKAKPKAPLYLPETTVCLSLLVVTSALRLGRLDLATELVTALVGGLVGGGGTGMPRSNRIGWNRQVWHGTRPPTDCLTRPSIHPTQTNHQAGYVRKQPHRRTLDPLAAKAVFYLALCYERAGRLSTLRPLLVALHRTACLRHDEMGQATVLNILLRSLLADNLIEQVRCDAPPLPPYHPSILLTTDGRPSPPQPPQAGNLVSRTSSFPEGASNNQLCRYLYYVGRIRALQLDYTDAHTKLNQARRLALP